MITSMNRPGESEFAMNGFHMCGPGTMVGGFESPSEDLFAAAVRGSGTGSPASSTEGPSSNMPPGGVEDASKSFPIVLHTIISDESTDNCVHWLPCGTRFVISDKDAFSRDVLPQYFGQRGGSATKFTSFTRRLKRWNFSRVPSGREMGAYFHQHFQRGDPELAKKILYPNRPGGPGSSQTQTKTDGKAGGAAKKPARRPSLSKSAVTVTKARRRASTGSLALPRRPVATGGETPFDLDAVLDSISPTPIRPSITDNAEPFISGGNIMPPPILENDFKDWLTSADLLSDVAEGNETPSTVHEPMAIQSTSGFMLPPLSFPNNVVSGGPLQIRQQQLHQQQLNQQQLQQQPQFHQQQPQPMMMRPGLAVRRHSVQIGALNQMQMQAMMAGMTGGKASPPTFNASTQLMGTNFATEQVPSSVPSGGGINSGITGGAMGNDGAAGPAPASNASSNAFNGMTVTVPSPLPSMTVSGGPEIDESPSFDREFSFGDMKVIDPFT